MNDELHRLGLIDDEDIVLDVAALSLAALDHPATDLTTYRDLIEAIAIRLDGVGRDAASARRAPTRCRMSSRTRSGSPATATPTTIRRTRT